MALCLLKAAVDAHQVFRGQTVDAETFISRTHKRVEESFDLYRNGHQAQPLQDQLQKLLRPGIENIALVAAQGGLAWLVKCNAQAVLNLAKEAPEQWIRVVCAEDGDMFIGAEKPQ